MPYKSNKTDIMDFQKRCNDYFSEEKTSCNFKIRFGKLNYKNPKKHPIKTILLKKNKLVKLSDCSYKNQIVRELLKYQR